MRKALWRRKKTRCAGRGFRDNRSVGLRPTGRSGFQPSVAPESIPCLAFLADSRLEAAMTSRPEADTPSLTAAWQLVQPVFFRLVCVMGVVAIATAARAEEGASRRRLAATLFGRTVGEVVLSTGVRGNLRTLTYRSELLVVRDRVRLRQKAFLEAEWNDATGALVQALARRCSEPEDGSAPPTCTSARRTDAAQAAGAAPALAAEVLLARGMGAQGKDGERCLDVVDEQTGARGRACATAAAGEAGVELKGSKMGAPFRAVVRDGLPDLFELPAQGAAFEAVRGAVEVTDEDLFAEPVAWTGEVRPALRRGVVKLRVDGPPETLRALREVALAWQRATDGAGSLSVEISRVSLPRGREARRVLDAAALLVAQAAGRHVDCQTATAWFVEKARARGWKVRPVTGFAFVDGRFAFHEWAVVETGGAAVPVDPLLAQVPADPGHVVLSEGAGAGGVLIAARHGLSVKVMER